MAIGSIWTPSLANAVYALVISRSETSAVPNANEGYAGVFDISMPRFEAMALIFLAAGSSFHNSLVPGSPAISGSKRTVILFRLLASASRRLMLIGPDATVSSLGSHTFPFLS